MSYSIINNKLYKIGEDGSMTEISNFDSKTNFINEISKHIDKKEIVEEKLQKEKKRMDKIRKEVDEIGKEVDKIKDDKKDLVPDIGKIKTIEPEKKKRGRPKKI